MQGKYIDIGKRLESERYRLGFTQKYMAEQLDVSVRRYRRYENGDSVMIK